MIVTLILGYFLGDFFTGVFHWWEDRYAKTSWPVLGKLIAEPNIEHHQYPTNTCRRSYWYRNGAAIMATVPVLALCLYYQLWILSVALVVLSQGSETHMWAHKRMPRFIRVVQRTGLLISPRAHVEHHRRPYATDYCTVSDWLNYILTPIHFWRVPEWFVRVFLRVPVNADRAVY